MDSKEKFLEQISRQKDGDVRKVNLSAMSDLASAINAMKSYDLENKFSTAFSNYQTALNLLKNVRKAAMSYLSSYDTFIAAADKQGQQYETANDLYDEISEELSALGVSGSAELSKYGDFLSKGKAQRQKAFTQIKTKFPALKELNNIA